jgi:acylpyruvate hydrolase
MRLATMRGTSGTTAVRIDGNTAVEVDSPDVGTLLRSDGWRALAARDGRSHQLADIEFGPVVPRPGKIICVGLNYRTHILEMGREVPSFPTLFAKYPEALIGPADLISLDPASNAVDWEAELAVVVGETVRRADDVRASAAIAGFAVLNDVTMRDWQYRTPEWLQGKTFEDTTPFGPHLVTPEELPGGVRPRVALTCTVDGTVVQSANTEDLVFDPVALIEYVSSILTLEPGDVIATGTPGGVGHARRPPAYLAEGAVVVTEIEGIGILRNRASVRTATP